MEPHLTDQQLAAMSAGTLSDAEVAAFERHLDICSACRTLAAELLRSTPRVSTGHSLAGRYQLGAPLGAGAMGLVFQALDPTLDRRIAVKVMRAEFARDPNAPDIRARFLREGRAMASISHPNVVAIFDVGESESGPFIAMELADGGSLQTWLGTRPPRDELIGKFLAAGAGLAAAHRAGIFHRDFKPANVLLTRDGIAKVSDFGLARVSSAAHSGHFVGTPRYMSPEQRAFQPADARSDQYSFAACFLEALTGALPQPGATLPAPGVSPSFDRALKRALSPDPRLRFPDMEALLVELGGPSPTTGSFSKRYRLLHRLGTGGMGDVFLAERLGEKGFVRQVAVKLMKLDATDPRVERLFAREARALASIHHRNVVQVFEFEREASRLYLVMEHVKGVDLRRLVDRKGTLEWPVALQLIAEVARGLHAAHGLRTDEAPAGLVHGDLSLSNVMIAADGGVKVLDFGLSKPAGQESSAQGLSGKLAYFAPELLGGQPKQASSDVYAVGVCLFELLTTKNPFSGASELETVRRISSGQRLPLVGFPAELTKLVDDALQPDPSRRPTALELATRADHLVGGAVSISQLAALTEGLLDAPLVPIEAFASPSDTMLPVKPSPAASSRRRVVAGALAVAALASLVTIVLARASTQPAQLPSKPVELTPTVVATAPPPVPEPTPPILDAGALAAAPARLVIVLPKHLKGTISVDGSLVGKNLTRAEVEVTAGAHQLVLTMGKTVSRSTVHVDAGETRTVTPRVTTRATTPRGDELLDPLPP